MSSQAISLVQSITALMLVASAIVLVYCAKTLGRVAENQQKQLVVLSKLLTQLLGVNVNDR